MRPAYTWVNVLAHVPSVRSRLPPPIYTCRIIRPMEKRVKVSKEKFDAALSKILQAKPIPRSKVKVQAHKPHKIIQPQQ